MPTMTVVAPSIVPTRWRLGVLGVSGVSANNWTSAIRG